MGQYVSIWSLKFLQATWLLLTENSGGSLCRCLMDGLWLMIHSLTQKTEASLILCTQLTFFVHHGCFHVWYIKVTKIVFWQKSFILPIMCRIIGQTGNSTSPCEHSTHLGPPQTPFWDRMRPPDLCVFNRFWVFLKLEAYIGLGGRIGLNVGINCWCLKQKAMLSATF